MIKPDQIEAKQHAEWAGLQAADAVASSFFKAAQANGFGHTESKYVEYLRKVIYRKSLETIGYGVKFWPKETDELIAKNPLLEWVNRMFEKR